MTGDNLSLVLTSDGSHSLLNKELNETYHSLHGAVQESLHVFIKMGLEFFLQQSRPEVVRIFEVGFGTGLNALLTSQFAITHNVNVLYTSIEAYPLSKEVARQLNYATLSDDVGTFERLHSTAWGQELQVTSRFTLNKVHARLQEHDPAPMDIIFFDAFAPAKQPEMWEPALLNKVCKALTPDGVFVTYSAKGQLKRDLRTLGLAVETLSGPPGKKEMVRAVKPSESSNFAN